MVDFQYPCINNLGESRDDWIVGLRYPGSNFSITRCFGLDHDWKLSSAEADTTAYKSNGLWTSALLNPIFTKLSTHPAVGSYRYTWKVDSPTFLSGDGAGWSTWGEYGIEKRNWAYEGQTKSFAIYKGELKTQIGSKKHSSIRNYALNIPESPTPPEEPYHKEPEPTDNPDRYECVGSYVLVGDEVVLHGQGTSRFFLAGEIPGAVNPQQTYEKMLERMAEDVEPFHPGALSNPRFYLEEILVVTKDHHGEIELVYLQDNQPRPASLFFVRTRFSIRSVANSTEHAYRLYDSQNLTPEGRPRYIEEGSWHMLNYITYEDVNLHFQCPPAPPPPPLPPPPTPPPPPPPRDSPPPPDDPQDPPTPYEDPVITFSSVPFPLVPQPAITGFYSRYSRGTITIDQNGDFRGNSNENFYTSGEYPSNAGALSGEIFNQGSGDTDRFGIYRVVNGVRERIDVRTLSYTVVGSERPSTSPEGHPLTTYDTVFIDEGYVYLNYFHQPFLPTWKDAGSTEAPYAFIRSTLAIHATISGGGNCGSYRAMREQRLTTINAPSNVVTRAEISARKINTPELLGFLYDENSQLTSTWRVTFVDANKQTKIWGTEFIEGIGYFLRSSLFDTRRNIPERLWERFADCSIPDELADDPPNSDKIPTPDPRAQINGSGSDRIEITGKTFLSETITADYTYTETASYVITDFSGYKLTAKNINKSCELLLLRGHLGSGITIETKMTEDFTDKLNSRYAVTARYYLTRESGKQEVNTASTFLVRCSTTLNLNPDTSSIDFNCSVTIQKRLYTGLTNGEKTYKPNPFFTNLIGAKVAVSQSLGDSDWLAKGIISGINGSEDNDNYMVTSLLIAVSDIKKVKFTAFGINNGVVWCDNGSLLNTVIFASGNFGYVDNTNQSYLEAPLKNIGQLNLIGDIFYVSQNPQAEEKRNQVEEWQFTSSPSGRLNLSQVEATEDNIFPYDSGQTLRSTSYYSE